MRILTLLALLFPILTLTAAAQSGKVVNMLPDEVVVIHCEGEVASPGQEAEIYFRAPGLEQDLIIGSAKVESAGGAGLVRARMLVAGSRAQPGNLVRFSGGQAGAVRWLEQYWPWLAGGLAVLVLLLFLPRLLKPSHAPHPPVPGAAVPAQGRGGRTGAVILLILLLGGIGAGGWYLKNRKKPEPVRQAATTSRIPPTALLVPVPPGRVADIPPVNPPTVPNPPVQPPPVAMPVLTTGVIQVNPGGYRREDGLLGLHVSAPVTATAATAANFEVLISDSTGQPLRSENPAVANAAGQLAAKAGQQFQPGSGTALVLVPFNAIPLRTGTHSITITATLTLLDGTVIPCGQPVPFSLIVPAERINQVSVQHGVAQTTPPGHGPGMTLTVDAVCESLAGAQGYAIMFWHRAGQPGRLPGSVQSYSYQGQLACSTQFTLPAGNTRQSLQLSMPYALLPQGEKSFAAEVSFCDAAGKEIARSGLVPVMMP